MTGANCTTRLSFGNQIFGSGAFLKDFDGARRDTSSANPTALQEYGALAANANKSVQKQNDLVT